jgi:hypothetical protein
MKGALGRQIYCNSNHDKGRRSRDRMRMVVRFITTYATSAYQH